MKREETIGFRVRELSLSIKRAGPCRKNSCSDGRLARMTRMQDWVVGYLYEHRGENVYQRDIEKRFSVRRPTMTAILQLMEKNGLILRRRDENDARLKKILLTDRAVELHEQRGGEVEEFENFIRRGISARELETFFGVIDKIKKNIEEMENEADETLDEIR